jgi:hypothetical protein
MNASLTLSSPEVLRLLEQPFVIIAGSAVSGVAPPSLPMVDPVKKAVIGHIARIAKEKGNPDLQKHASQLLEKSHQHLLKNTKFEEFMFFAFARLCEGRHRDVLDDLVARLFQCPPSLYGVNHSAIAYLVEHGHALACLTTNFDNALENAWPHWIIEHERVPDELRQHHLVKLHGDAAKHTTVCTSRDLIAVGQRRGMRNIRNLLDGRRVLVVGYSGHGDTDIAPELRDAQGAEFIWAVRDESEEPRRPRDEAPEFARWQFETNLAVSNKPNVLWALATSLGWQGCSGPSARHDWESPLRTWCEARSSEHHTKFVSAFYEWRDVRDRPVSGTTPFDAAQQQAQEGRYWSAMRTLEAAGAETLDASDDDPTWIHMRAHLGLCMRQVGFWQRSLRVLEVVVRDTLGRSAPRLAMFRSDACRQYLETCCEFLYSTPPRDRRQLAETLLADKVADLLEEWSPDEALTPDCFFRQRISSAEVRSIRGDRSATSDLETLAITARDSQNYRSAFAAVRALMPIAPDLARKLFDSIDEAERDENEKPRRPAIERRLLLWLSNPENPRIGRRLLRPLLFQLRCAKSEIRHRLRF